MKILFIIFILSSSIFSQIYVNKENAEDKNLLINNSLPIKASMEVLEKIFCDKYITNLNLRISYKNIGKKNVILYKDMLSAQDKLKGIDSNGKETEYAQIFGTQYFLEPDKKNKKKSEGLIKKNIIILAPGEVYEIENVYHSLPLTITIGEYSLEKTIPFSNISKLEDLLPSDWRTTSIFWNKDITTAPLTFTITKEDKFSSINCDEIRIKSEYGCHVSVTGKKTCLNLLKR